jgi:hypothetical protein
MQHVAQRLRLMTVPMCTRSAPQLMCHVAQRLRLMTATRMPLAKSRYTASQTASVMCHMMQTLIRLVITTRILTANSSCTAVWAVRNF